MNGSENDAELEPGEGAGAANGSTGAQGAGAETGASELSQRLAEAEAKAAEYLDNWRRSVADLSNARKRMQREQDEMRRSAAGRVLEKLIPVLDDVDRAFANVPEGQAESDWVNGFRMIQRKLQGLIESEGVVTIPAAAGQQFDPNLHYAVTHEEADGLNEGQIIAEVAKGYKLDDKILRPSMVRVAKG
jgi:molecular chaperone GrpE